MSEAAFYDCAAVKVGARPRGEMFARAAHRKTAKMEDLELFLMVLRNILVCGDQEEGLREVAHSTAGRLGMPTGVTTVEQSEANGLVQQNVRALRERLHIIVEDVRRTGVEVFVDHLLAQWAVRHTDWTHTSS